MTNIGGLKQRIAFATEATYGTDPGSGYMTIGQIQGTPTVTGDNQIFPIHSAGRINARKILTKAFKCTASIDYFAQDGAFIVASIGDFDTTSPVTNGSNYIHYGCSEDSTSTDANPVEYECKPYSLSVGLEKGTTDDVLKLTGCKTNTLRISLDQNEPLRVSADIIAQKFKYETAAETITEFDYGPWMYHNKGALNINGTATADVVSLNVSVANNLHEVGGILPHDNKRCITDLLQGPRTITGTVVLNYDTYTELSYFLDTATNATEPSDSDVKELDIDVLLDNGETTTDEAYRGLFLDIKELKFGTSERRIPVDGNVVQETFTFTAKKIDVKYYDDQSSDPW